MLTFKISSGLLFVLVFTNYQNNDTCLERHKETYHNKTQNSPPPQKKQNFYLSISRVYPKPIKWKNSFLFSFTIKLAVILFLKFPW